MTTTSRQNRLTLIDEIDVFGEEIQTAYSALDDLYSPVRALENSCDSYNDNEAREYVEQITGLIDSALSELDEAVGLCETASMQLEVPVNTYHVSVSRSVEAEDREHALALFVNCVRHDSEQLVWLVNKVED